MRFAKTLFFPWIEVAKSLYHPLQAKEDAPLYRIFLPLVFVMIAVWIVTVPVHELLHAAGCLLTGGEVTELTLQPLYGGTLLSRIFSFVTPGGDYAGQLKGFDTGGSDFCYFVTDCFPFILTVLFGIPLLTISARSGNTIWYGIGAVQTLLPVVSITGDYYEMGSITATRILGIKTASERAALIRGDDLFLVISRVREAAPENGLLIIALGVVLGIVYMTITIDLSFLFARVLSRKNRKTP